MSFKLKDKTVFLSLISVITLIFSITFCILVLNNEKEYNETFKTIIALIVGYFFKSENTNGSRETKIE